MKKGLISPFFVSKEEEKKEKRVVVKGGISIKLRVKVEEDEASTL